MYYVFIGGLKDRFSLMYVVLERVVYDVLNFNIGGLIIKR